MKYVKKSMEELDRQPLSDLKNSTKFPYALVLDNIRSMNNVGSAFRTADALNCREIILVGITAQPPHREIAKTALGAEESVKWTYFNTIQEAIHYLKNQSYLLIAIEQTHHSTQLENFQVDDQQSYAFIFGNEVYGVEETFLNSVDQVIEISQFGMKHSINVSVTMGIIAWEFVSQKLKGLSF